jgi:hypothetical protein
MTDPRIDISTALEVDEDFPVADLIYDGDHWASATFKQDGQLIVTVYGQPAGANPLPIEAAIESLEQAKAQLNDIMSGGTEAP